MSNVLVMDTIELDTQDEVNELGSLNDEVHDPVINLRLPLHEIFE